MVYLGPCTSKIPKKWPKKETSRFCWIFSFKKLCCLKFRYQQFLMFQENLKAPDPTVREWQKILKCWTWTWTHFFFIGTSKIFMRLNVLFSEGFQPQNVLVFFLFSRKSFYLLILIGYFNSVATKGNIPRGNIWLHNKRWLWRCSVHSFVGKF